jgi:hypothetical protein
MGNVADVEEMIEHFGYLLPELYRVLMPGRSVAIHLAQAQTRKRDGGEIGLRDFRGATIDVMTRHGFTFYGEVTIDKDPQVKAIRTKDRGLLFKTLAKDSAHMRMAQADYLLQFRKPGENPHPIPAGISERYGNTDGWITPEEWIEWAAPVWYRASENYPGGIRETDVLNVAMAREDRDERHLCPLQLGVIERAVKLWSAPGETRAVAVRWRRLGGLRGATPWPAVRGRRAQALLLRDGRAEPAHGRDGEGSADARLRP